MRSREIPWIPFVVRVVTPSRQLIRRQRRRDRNRALSFSTADLLTVHARVSFPKMLFRYFSSPENVPTFWRKQARLQLCREYEMTLGHEPRILWRQQDEQSARLIGLISRVSSGCRSANSILAEWPRFRENVFKYKTHALFSLFNEFYYWKKCRNFYTIYKIFFYLFLSSI